MGHDETSNSYDVVLSYPFYSTVSFRTMVFVDSGYDRITAENRLKNG